MYIYNIIFFRFGPQHPNDRRGEKAEPNRSVTIKIITKKKKKEWARASVGREGMK